MDNSSKNADLDFNIISGRRINITLNLKNQIDHLILHGDIAVMALDSPPNTKYRSMMKKTLDICKLITDPMYEPILYPMWQDVLQDKRNKLGRKCPFPPVSSPKYYTISHKSLISTNIYFLAGCLLYTKLCN